MLKPDGSNCCRAHLNKLQSIKNIHELFWFGFHVMFFESSTHGDFPCTTKSERGTASLQCCYSFYVHIRIIFL